MSLPNYVGCLMEFIVFINILYENVFQNPEFFPTQVSISPKQSTLDCVHFSKKNYFLRNSREIREKKNRNSN
jgi:hypothetical protein